MDAREPDDAGPFRVTRGLIARSRTLEELAALFERGGSSPVDAIRAAKKTLEAREMRARAGRTLKQIYKGKRRR